MTSGMQAQIEESLAQLAATRGAMEQLRQLAADATVTQKSKNRMVSVTVGSRGELKSLTFAGEGYRSLAPAELAKLIVDTIEGAREKCRAETMKSIEELMPAGTRGMRLGESGSFDEMVKQFVRTSGSDLSDEELAQFDASWTTGR